MCVFPVEFLYHVSMVGGLVWRSRFTVLSPNDDLEPLQQCKHTTRTAKHQQHAGPASAVAAVVAAVAAAVAVAVAALWLDKLVGMQASAWCNAAAGWVQIVRSRVAGGRGRAEQLAAELAVGVGWVAGWLLCAVWV